MIRLIKLFIILLVSACSNDTFFNTDSPKNLTPNFMYGQPKELKINETKQVAVFLPLTGNNSELGNSIARSIEMAVFQTKPTDIVFSFYDIGENNKYETIEKAKSLNPDLIIGPIFSNDVELIKNAMSNVPMISFSSNSGILDSNTWTMALMPNQQIERVLNVAQQKGNNKLVIIAPDSEYGYIMSNSALNTADHLDMDVVSLYYYTENDKEYIKSVAEKVAKYNARKNANKQAKELIAENLASNNSQLSVADIHNLNSQLDLLARNETLGELEFDSILLLGSGSDLSSLNSYLRFYDIPSNILRIGTAVWDTPEILNDIVFVNGIYPNLPEQNQNFVSIYETMEGKKPTRMASMGYDATMIAINSLHSNDLIENLTNPSGFGGIDGIIRFKSNGVSERGLSVLAITNYGPQIISSAPDNFIGKSYKNKIDNSKTREFDKTSKNIDIYKYLQLPEKITVKAVKNYEITDNSDEVYSFNPEDTEIITDDTFQKIESNNVEQKQLDNIKIKKKVKNKQ